MSSRALAVVPGGRTTFMLATLVLVGMFVVVSGMLWPGVELNLETALAGLLVGALVGLSGMGSGALMAPLLILVLGVAPVTAIGTDLAYAAITKVVGGVQHARQQTVNFRLVRLLASGSVPAALISVQILEYLRRTYPMATVNAAMTRVLGLTLTLVALTILIGLVRNRRSGTGSDLAEPERATSPAAATSRAEADPAESRQVEKKFVALGAGVGFLVGLTSVGSGSIVVALLSVSSKLPARRIVGTDIAHAAALTAVAGLAHGLAGNVDPSLLLNLLVGSIPGVLLGSHLSARFPEPVLRATLGIVLLATGVKLA